MAVLRDLPIRQKLMIAIVGSSALAVFIISAVFIAQSWVGLRQAIVQNVSAITEVFSLNTTAALSFNDAQAANETLSSLRAEEEIKLACIYSDLDGSGPRQFATYVKDGVRNQCPESPPEQNHISTNMLVMVKPIWLGNEKMGSLYVERDLSDLWRTTQFNVIVMVSMMLVSVLIAAFITAFLQKMIAVPLLELLGAMVRVSEKKDYSLRAPRASADEVGKLIDGFNGMLAQIEERDKALEEAKSELEMRIEQGEVANRELQAAMERLKKTQEQLVNTEKMASLGSLVAGVAHEINTPVGVGVTAASTLKMNTEETHDAYESGKLTNSGLNKYFNHAMQSSDIILSNLNRAADLIHSFKQVAVDQSSSEYRQFNVKDYIYEILLSLRPKLKKTRIDVEVECEDKLVIDSVPGAISQVLTNLVMNSLIHAYDDNEAGTIRICVDQSDGWIHLVYADDGKGMSRDSVTRVFDPFFTTKRGAGGSGLGMHIVYNLVTQQLHGQVSLSSEEGKGTTVEIDFPTTKEARYGNGKRNTETAR